MSTGWTNAAKTRELCAAPAPKDDGWCFHQFLMTRTTGSGSHWGAHRCLAGAGAAWLCYNQSPCPPLEPGGKLQSSVHAQHLAASGSEVQRPGRGATANRQHHLCLPAACIKLQTEYSPVKVFLQGCWGLGFPQMLWQEHAVLWGSP